MYDEKFPRELALQGLHDSLGPRVRIEDERITRVVAHSEQRPILREQRSTDVDVGVRVHERRILLVGQIDEPQRIASLEIRKCVGFVRIIAVDGDRREVIVAREGLEARQPPQTPLAFEPRIIRISGAGEAPSQADVTVHVGRPTADRIAGVFAQA